ncbi:flagella basal body P-ring formation protein FlgA [Erythrobacter sp. JK5]|uniref:flagella basal body P-ring formation protein FlgA n=1 Tax=Erythrobacter sp. JK5 TaxID=2829500 RepID=UPI001BAC0FE6|nr:flagella basal body P-ring formation protein FlgA [Erythrobacter sp. JK5]QUL36932.1 flagella basal body P-ring formation protein FlgA [Erythrobacter sp. JK5]
MRSFINLFGFAPVALIMFVPLFSPAFGAGAGQAFTDPGDIDRAVAEFTGAAIGEVGGARAPADRRLKLARCDAPLLADWHGTAKTTVRVECPAAAGWRIFVATRPHPQDAQQQRVVKRGDPVTVLVRGRGFSVQQSGEALENGAIGDWIGIRTARHADPVRARIERPGLAVIPAS